jgi:uncharacterized protein
MNRESSPLAKRNLKINYNLAGSEKNVKGTIESFTIVHNPPSGFEKFSPYIIALISLDDGTKVTSQIVDCADVEIGMAVKPCLRKVYDYTRNGLIHYGTKFKVIR